MLVATGFLIGRQFMYLNIDSLLFSISQGTKLLIRNRRDQSATTKTDQLSERPISNSRDCAPMVVLD